MGGLESQWNAQVAHAICRQSRTQLGGALAEVRADMSIARRQRAKQGLSDMAEMLRELKAAVARTDELRCVLGQCVRVRDL
jgi:hypothetical protein